MWSYRCRWLAALAVLSCCVWVGWTSAGEEFSQIWGRATTSRLRNVQAADLTGDGFAEVLLLTGGRGGPVEMNALDPVDGSSLWRRSLLPGGCAVPVRRGSGTRCDVAAASGDTLLILVGASGRVRARGTLPGVVGELAVGDLTGDGGDEVVCTSGNDLNDALTCWDAAEAAQLWRLKCSPVEGRRDDGFGLPLVIPGEGLNGPSVVVREHRTNVTLVSADGLVDWRTSVGTASGPVPLGMIVAGPFAADLEGISRLDVVVGTLDGHLVVLDGVSGDVLRSRVFGGDGHRELAARRRLPSSVRSLLLESGEPASGYSAVEANGVPGDELLFVTADGVAHEYSARADTLLWARALGACPEFGPVVVQTPSGTPGAVVATPDSTFVIGIQSGVSIRGLVPTAGCTRVLLESFLPGETLSILRADWRSGTLALHPTRLVPVR